MDTEVATVITEVEVDHNDKAFEDPTKPIGLFYEEEEAKALTAERGWNMVEDAHRGWRRVVASPVPVSIVQLETIRRLVEAGVSVVCCGGGGIPVERDDDGHIIGLEAVIDKDRASALLAVQLGARRLVITTAIDAVYADFMGPNQRALRKTTLEEVRQLGRDGHFAPGSMRPKMEAAIYFLNRGGEEVIVCKPEDLVEAFDGDAGTHITRG
jgi:carbamate kinase